MDPNEGLCIFEYDCSSGQKRLELEKQLRLLPRQNLEIPSHLQEPFSHWYSHSTKTVIFRPPEASQPDIHYIMSQEGMFFIPLKDRTLQISNLLSKSNSYERLLLGGTPFSQALDSSGFERVVNSFLCSQRIHLLSRNCATAYPVTALTFSKTLKGFTRKSMKVTNLLEIRISQIRCLV